MKYLIINADDFGLDHDINRGIGVCYSSGRVTDFSLVSCGKSFSGAVKLLKDYNRKEAGLHFILTDGLKPVFPEIESVDSLVDKEGKFHKEPISFLKRYYKGGIVRDHIKKELEAQVMKVLDEGLSIKHINSHHHIHMLPAIWNLVAEISEKYRIPYIRYSVEPPSIYRRDFSFGHFMKSMALRISCVNSKMSGKRVFFWGLYYSGRLDSRALHTVIRNLKHGINELSVHPAFVTGALMDFSKWYAGGEEEIEALLSPDWYKYMESNDVRLISYNEAETV